MTDKQAENEIYHLWRESESYQVPMTEEGVKLADQRYHGFKKGYMARREWQGLTDEEIGELYRAGWGNNTDFARAIEAKLKEKNT